MYFYIVKKTLLVNYLCLFSLIFCQAIDFNHNGYIRQYFLHQPENIQVGAPLVFALHGYGGGPDWMIDNTGLNEIADQNGFAVCYPMGTTDSWNNRFWNVGYAFHDEIEINDVDFLSSLAHFLHNEYGYSPNKTYSTGMSNGGDMSYMLGCQASYIFRSIAPVAGSMMETIYNSCNSVPISVLEIHGTNDSITLWNGDMENNDGWGAYLGTEAGIEFWSGSSNCLYSEDIVLFGLNTINHRYFGCDNNTEVWLYEVVNGGHDWPSFASQEIWDFFTQFSIIEEDINLDGVINILDVIQIVNLILQSDSDNIGDINNDYNVDVLDVILLVNLVLSY